MNKALLNAAVREVLRRMPTGTKRVPRKGIASSQCIRLGIFGQFTDGSYLASDIYPGAGKGCAALAVVTGDPAKIVMTSSAYNAVPVMSTADYTIKRMPTVSCFGVSADNPNPLLNVAGDATIGNDNNNISYAWIMSNNDIIFAVNGSGGYYFLYRAKATGNPKDGVFTIGNDAACTNRRAIMAIGEHGGVHAAEIRQLGPASLLEAKVTEYDAATKANIFVTYYYFCEYNVSTLKGATPGGANDQVKIRRSKDGGMTWEVFFEWNTNGTHQVSHIHGARQDPHTGWLYFLTGDYQNENAIIGYNGTAPKVATNSTFAQIAATPGYRIISGNELYRHVDLCFKADEPGIFGMPDADTEGYERGTVANVTTQFDRMLNYSASLAPIPGRRDGAPPFAALQHPRIGALYVGFRGNAGLTPGNPYIDLWSANVEDGEWAHIGMLNTNRNGTSVVNSFFVDDKDRVWVGAITKRGVTFDPALTKDASGNPITSNYTSSLALTMADRVDNPTAPFVIDGP